MYGNNFLKMGKVRWLFNFKMWNPTLEDLSTALSMIQPEEKTRILQFVFKKDAKASLVGRLMMRKYASEYLTVPWNEIHFGRLDKGKPFVVQPKANEGSLVEFNVSHQGSYCAFAGEGTVEIGTDIMEVENFHKNVPEYFRLMRRQFSSTEWQHIYSFPSEAEQLQAFYRNWCLKESYVKCIGTGITINLQSISFTALSNLSPKTTINNTIVTVNNEVEKNWVFEETLLEDNHIFTVAFVDVEQAASHDKVPLEYLSFHELITNGLPVSGNSDEEAKSFIEKPECPQAYK